MTSFTYAESGVSLDVAEAIVPRLAAAVRSTLTPGQPQSHGGFAGLYALPGGVTLAAATDGVGTKLELLRASGRLHDAGIDCVAMVVNDVLCTGATPAFMLDYISCGRIDPETIAELVEGVADGCRQAGCVLLGGETAEHPGVQDPDELDIAGFCVGVIAPGQALDPTACQSGDALIGLAASGPHANGFSLVRRLLAHHRLEARDEPGLLTPTTIYAAAVQRLRAAVDVRALAHITGGGIEGNLPRSLPAGLAARVALGSWPRPPAFDRIAALGVDEDELRRVFNCGIGMIAVVPGEAAVAALDTLAAGGVAGFRIGELVAGEGVQYA